jgi:hypothetical protein
MKNKVKHIKNINDYIEKRFLTNEIYINDLIAVANIPQFELLILSCDVNCVLDNYEFNPIKQSFVLRELCQWSIIDDMDEYFLVDNDTVERLADHDCFSLVLSYDELIKCSKWLSAIKQAEQS